MRFNTTIVYKGLSLFPDENGIYHPIVVLATNRSKNRKTDRMTQYYILRDDIHPVLAVRLGLDISICGRCKLRAGRGCYVIVGFGPASVWGAYKRGNVNPIDPEYLRYLAARQPSRLGAYGDPMAVPRHVWNDAFYGKQNHTGYTSSWMESHAEQYKDILMASVHDVQEYTTAAMAGWRVYYTPLDGSDPSKMGLVRCPASKEAIIERQAKGNMKHISCASCLLCNGNGTQAASIHADPHGSKGTLSRLNQAREIYTIK